MKTVTNNIIEIKKGKFHVTLLKFGNNFVWYEKCGVSINGGIVPFKGKVTKSVERDMYDLILSNALSERFISKFGEKYVKDVNLIDKFMDEYESLKLLLAKKLSI